MTIKLISKGKKPEENIYQGKCFNCNSIVQASPSDGRVTSDQRDGSFFSFDCPVCNHLMHIDISEKNQVG